MSDREVVRTDQATELATAADLPADRHPALVYITSLQSDASRRTMRAALNSIAELMTDGEADLRTFPWHQLRYQHTQAVRSKLADEYAPSTVNNRLSALRGVLKEAWRLGHMDADTYQKAADVSNLKSDRLPSGRRLSLGEIHALKEVCAADDPPKGPRDLAILAVLSRAGLRRSELVGLDREDYRAQTDRVEADVGELEVRGAKGNKDRVVALANGAKEALDGWLDVRPEGPDPLFLPLERDGTLADRRMSANAVYMMLQARAEEADVEEFSPHDLRRTCASDLLEYGNDLSVTGAMLGHASTDTTRRYDRRGDQAKRKAAGTLPF